MRAWSDGVLAVALVGLLAACPARAPGEGATSHPATVVPGKVTVLPGARSLAVGGIIRVTVANGLTRPIYTADLKSDCSIVLLERWTGGAWQPVPGCALGRAPLVVTIGPGQVRSVQINPRSLHFLEGRPADPARPPVGAGTYRIRFTYRLVPGREGEEPYAVSSETFRVVP